ncbi:hypothetical protein [Bradyrhizobium sp. SZCCHNG3015]|uniref:hypothetical protein n=1 Tax=Bradyrhizobium sp. SZCCHNG3015 TaxID=3057270 RepID=UPI0028F116AC|nr:hypothetical protein [Bradyrhizobium sp. SZCCHNG3015]
MAILLCASLTFDSLFLSRAKAEEQSIWETRVFVADDCPTNDAPAPSIAPLLLTILSFLIPKAVDFGLSYANASIQQKKEEEQKKNEERSADAVGTYRAFYGDVQITEGGKKRPATALALQDKCLVVLRANFSRIKATPPNDCDQFSHSQLKAAKACQWLHDRGVYPSESSSSKGIGIYLEAKFAFSPDKLNFRLQPHYFAYDHAIQAASSPGEIKTPYDLTYTVTFEGAGGGQAVTPFGMAVLSFQQISESIALDAKGLSQKSSGWTPIMPTTDAHTTAMQRITTLYDAVEALPAQIAEQQAALDATQARVSLLLTQLTSLPPAPDAPAGDTLKDGAARLVALRNSELFDDRVLDAELNSKPETSPTTESDPLKAAEKQLKRVRATRDREALRARANDLATTVESGLALRQAVKHAQLDLQQKQEEINKWAATAHESGAINIKVSLKEKSYAPTNLLLLTAADAFAASKHDLSSFVSQNLIQGLGLQPRDEKLSKLAEQAQLQIAARTALTAEQDAQGDLDSLPITAGDQVRRQKQLALDSAKINANVAYARAGLTPPFPESFGGAFR